MQCRYCGSYVRHTAAVCSGCGEILRVGPALPDASPAHEKPPEEVGNAEPAGLQPFSHRQAGSNNTGEPVVTPEEEMQLSGLLCPRCESALYVGQKRCGACGLKYFELYKLSRSKWIWLIPVAGLIIVLIATPMRGAARSVMAALLAFVRLFSRLIRLVKKYNDE